jgi:hypothetical protein
MLGYFSFLVNACFSSNPTGRWPELVDGDETSPDFIYHCRWGNQAVNFL